MKTLVYPEAIFFDWDGTLVDSYAFLENAHNFVRSKFGLSRFADAEFDKYFGLPREVLFTEIYGHKSQDAKVAFEQYYLDNHLTQMIVKDGAENMLEIISGLGILMGVVSNKKANFLQSEVEYLGWQRFFGDAIIGAGVAVADKPDPAPLILGISLYDNIEVGNVWYVGDTEVDVGCARSAGCPCILIAPLGIETGNGVWQKNYDEICGFLLQ